MELFDFQVQTKGFTPTKKEEQLIRSMVDRLQWEAPSDANIKLEITKGNVLFRTQCEIKSVVKCFQGQSASENIYPALKLIERKMLVQIENWKLSRSNISREFRAPASQGLSQPA